MFQFDTNTNSQQSISIHCKEALNTIPDIVFIVNRDWVVEYTNKIAREQISTKSGEFQGKSIIELVEEQVATDEVGQFRTVLKKAFADEGSFPRTIVLDRGVPNAQGLIAYQLAPIYRNRNVAKVAVIARKVEDRHQISNITSALSDFETAFQNSSDGMFLIDVESSSIDRDVEFRVLRINSAFEAITGLTAEEFQGEISQTTSNQNMNIFQKCRECTKKGEPIQYEEEFRSSQEKVVAETNLTPVTNDSRVTNVVGVVRDVTERTGKKQTSNQYEQQLAGLHRATRELLEAKTPEEAAMIASEAAEEILDLPLNGIYFDNDSVNGLKPVAISDTSSVSVSEAPIIEQGRVWEVYQSGESRIYDELSEPKVYNIGPPMRSEIIIPIGNHGVFIASSPEVEAFDEADVEATRTLAANTEIALERITKEERLRSRTKELEEQNSRLNEFASIVSHDLRNPLMLAEGSLDLARNEQDSEHLRDVSKAHDRMQTLIDDLLKSAREGGQLNRKVPINLDQLAEDCWRNVGTSEGTLKVKSTQKLLADPSRLRQLFENLYRNAIEHTSSDVIISVGEHSDGFYVEDDGQGIPEEDYKSVFEAGYSTSEDGSGLGLDIVEQVVDAHGWDICLTEGSDGGARFEIHDVEFAGKYNR
jgi:PAS domain S-box-containing protein